MSKRILAALCVCVLTAAGAEVRRASWSGQFYDADPARLAAQIDAFLKAAAPTATGREGLVALIAPHAGYVYSGRVAANAYALARGADYETVVVLAPSHNLAFEGCSIDASDGFETPLGLLALDKELALALQKESGFGYIPRAHETEHAVEVQLPFIQKTLPRAKAVLVIMGLPSARTVKKLAESLARISTGRKILVIASTDMSHFLSKAEANALDASTIDLIKGIKTDALLRKLDQRENILCGGGPVVAALLYAQKRGAARADVLAYADSSQAGGPQNRVVGYTAVALRAGPSGRTETAYTLTREEKEELLRLARQAVAKAVQEGQPLSATSANPNLTAPRGAFVTLTKRGELRGCIGFIEPVAPLYQTVIQAAVYAALEDRRFRPVTEDELPEIAVEVSVLTPLAPVKDPLLIQVGRHGLVIEYQGRKGLLLPQVATENGWTREEFLRQICFKAGLPPDSWKKGAALYTFEAIVFH